MLAASPDRSIHTIFVPPGFSPEQVWEHVSRCEPVPVDGVLEEDGEWVNVEIEGGHEHDGFWVDGKLKKVL